MCNYYVKVFKWFRELPALLTNKKWFLVRRRRSLRAPAGRTRLKKPTTANRERLEAAFKELLEFMPNVYEGSAISPENIAHFPAGTEVEMESEQVAPGVVGRRRCPLCTCSALPRPELLPRRGSRQRAR